MQDVTDAFLRARSRGPWPVDQVASAVWEGRGCFAGLRCEWDAAAADEWARLLKTSMVLALAWAPGPLVIATTGHHDLDDEIEAITGIDVEQVNVAHFDAPVLSLQSDRISEIWPDREWPVDAVDPKAFSAHDLWYATC
jgi:hypothetical protein